MKFDLALPDAWLKKRTVLVSFPVKETVSEENFRRFVGR